MESALQAGRQAGSAGAGGTRSQAAGRASHGGGGRTGGSRLVAGVGGGSGGDEVGRLGATSPPTWPQTQASKLAGRQAGRQAALPAPTAQHSRLPLTPGICRAPLRAGWRKGQTRGRCLSPCGPWRWQSGCPQHPPNTTCTQAGTAFSFGVG